MNTIKLEKTLTIQASPETVFDFVTNPAKMSEILAGIFEADGIPELPLQAGSHFNYKYHLGDSILTGIWTVKKISAPSLYIAESHGLTTSTWTHEISKNEEGSLLKLTFEYQLPSGLLNPFQEKDIIALNEKNMDNILEALKKAFENN